MATEVILPRVDMDMTEGMITAWHVKDGDTIKQGEPIFDIETSKATMEVDAPATGTIHQITAAVGETVPVGTVIAWIYKNGEAVHDQRHGSEESNENIVVGVTTEQTAVVSDTSLADVSSNQMDSEGAVRATPAARRVARETGVDLSNIKGSGPQARIVQSDVMSAAGKCLGADSEDSRKKGADLLNRIWLHKGESPPLVLLHGFGAEGNSWRPLFNALRHVNLDKNVGVLAIDLPGHGKSPSNDTGSLDEIVKAIATTLQAEGIHECHLAGHSFGGAVAIMLSVSSQVRVSSLTLIAPAGLGAECNGAFIRGLTKASDRDRLTPLLLELVERPEVIDEAFIATAEQQLSSDAKRETLAGIAETYFPEGRQSIDVRKLIDTLVMPVRVIWGASDRIIPISHADGLPDRIVQHRFANVGHLPHVEALVDVAKIIGEQLSR